MAKYMAIVTLVLYSVYLIYNSAILGYSAYSIHILSSYQDVFGPSYMIPAIVSLFFTIIAVFVGAMGICTLQVHGKCLFYSYSVTKTIIFLIRVATIVVVVVFSNHYTTWVYEVMIGDFTAAKMHGWDRFQTEFKCCGVNNYTDYEKVAPILKSCCPGTCNIYDQNTTATTQIYYNGCFDAFSSWYKTSSLVLLIASCVSIVIYIVNTFCGCAFRYTGSVFHEADKLVSVKALATDKKK